MGGHGLYSTVGDYMRFIRMWLNDGNGEHGRVLKAETVRMAEKNHLGDKKVTMLPGVIPSLSNDAEFFPGLSKSWALTFMVNDEEAPTGRPAGALGWAGLANLFYWIDRRNGFGGFWAAQVLPFGDPVSFARLMTVPVFVGALAVATIVATGLASRGIDSLRPLLLLEFLVLAGAVGVSVVKGSTTVAVLLGVSAMAVQAALTRNAALGGASTTVMTTNVARFVSDVSEAVLGRDPDGAVRRGRLAVDGAAEIAGFIVGCGVGAVCQAAYGLRALVLPAALVLVALGVAGAADDIAQARKRD